MPAPFVEGPLRKAVRHLFNSDPKSSHAELGAYLRELPNDPLAHALSAAVDFYHYVSLRIPERDAQSIVGVLLGPGVAMPQAMQKQIGQTLRRVQTLVGNGSGSAGLLALCIVEGINRDGLALVSKRWSASLAHAERAHALAHKLLEADPEAHDAYFVFGSTEYLLSRIPAPARPFAHIPGVSGDRKKAIRLCQTAVKSGFYFQEFARRTLVNLYVEEGRLSDGAELLAQLVNEFPGNPMLREDLVRIQGRARKR